MVRKNLIFIIGVLLFSSCSEYNKAESYQEVNRLNQGARDSIISNAIGSLQIGRTALYKSQEVDYAKGETYALINISDAFEKLGDLDSSISYKLQALDVRLELKDSNQMGQSYLGLARNCYYLNQSNAQRKNLDLAKSMLRSEDTLLSIYYYTDLGRYFNSLEKDDSARLSFSAALSHAKFFSDKEQKALATENYGNILNQLDMVDSAMLYYNECIAMYDNDKVKLAGIYNNIAMLYWNTNQSDSVRKYLEKGYIETRDVGRNDELEINIENLIEYWEEQQNIKKSNGYLHELIELKDSVFSNNLDQRIAGIQKSFEVKLQKEENAKLEAQVNRKNTIRNASIIAAILVSLLAFYQFRVYKQKRRLAENEKQIKDNEIDQLLQERELKNMDAILEGRESEQKRIGRDLHDRLGSILSTVKLHFSAMDEKIDILKKENNQQFEKASVLLDEAVSEVRRISHDLTSGVLVKNGLRAALNDMKRTIESTGKLEINIFEAGEKQRLSLEFEISIYRVIQELLSNILKHAEASKIDMHITQTKDSFTLIVEDDGKGFDMAKTGAVGIGLANVKQRVASMGGTVNFDSRPGSGTTVIIEIEQEELKED